MTSSSTLLSRHFPPSLNWGRVHRAVLVVAAYVLCGCAGTVVDTDAIDSLPPLRLDGATLSVGAAASRIPRADLLSVDEPMREFVARYTAGQANSRMRLMSLHQAVRGAGGLNMQYDSFAEGTAREVFHRGVANCLSYANLFVALAREAGLDANYQWLEVRPQWSRVSERVQVGLHVNVVVRLREGRHYMVDIDPLPSRDITGSHELSDTEAEALYYNNFAVAALGNDELETAWSYLVRALQLSPSNAHLWVNLGAIYRASGQHREAEQSYLQALELDVAEYSAMTNLAILYGLEGREEEREFWLGRVERHRQANPYYHAWLGDEAAAAGDWASALSHYNRAAALAPGDSYLWYSRGVAYYQLDNPEAAVVDIEKAIELASLHSDIANYRIQLEQVRKVLSGL